MNSSLLLPVTLLVSALTISHASAQSTNVRARNTNQSVKFKSAIFKGSANLIESNSVTVFMGGGQSNAVTSGADYAVVGGGFENVVANDYGVVGGGGGNTVGGAAATVAGGEGNLASLAFATVGGGATNRAAATGSAVAGGGGNEANGAYSAIGGGFNNETAGSLAAIPGGNGNFATNYSFAAGRYASAEHDGSFVWGSAPGIVFTATESFAANTFTVRCHGGARFYTAAGTGTGPSVASGSGTWTALSDSNAKENFEDVDAEDILAKVVAMPVKTWNYKTQADSIRHIGPTAQDFKAAFGVGESDTGITTVDADGVALAAIQALVEELNKRDKAIEELKARLSIVEERSNFRPPAR